MHFCYPSFSVGGRNDKAQITSIIITGTQSGGAAECTTCIPGLFIINIEKRK